VEAAPDRQRASTRPGRRQRPGRGAKRALEIAAAGGHSLLMTGPPGSGKSMLAQRFAGLLPPMTVDEALQSAAIASLAGALPWRTGPSGPPAARTTRASAVALVGGGSPPRPGEISLAHHGVLFLDELPEFPAPRWRPCASRWRPATSPSRAAARRCEFPARFQLVAAMNPCPCGYLGSTQQGLPLHARPGGALPGQA
jgi:magnesium chelatase family protein